MYTSDVKNTRNTIVIRGGLTSQRPNRDISVIDYLLFFFFFGFNDEDIFANGYMRNILPTYKCRRRIRRQTK